MYTSSRTSPFRSLLNRLSALSLALGLVACGGPAPEDVQAQGSMPWDARNDAPWDAQEQSSTPWDARNDAPWDAQATTQQLGGDSQEPSVIIRGVTAQAIIRGLLPDGIQCHVAPAEQQETVICLPVE